MVTTVFARQRASGLDRCGYSGGPAPEMRGRLFVLLADLRWLGRLRTGRRRCGEPGGWCEGAHSWLRPTARAGALRAAGDISVRAGTYRRRRGHFCVGGDARRRVMSLDMGDSSVSRHR